MWIGTSKGLAFRSSGTDHYDFLRVNGKPLVTNVIGAMLLDKKNQLWIGADDHGMIIFDESGKETKRITKKEGLPSLKFSYIAQDANENIWITTRLGLVKLETESDAIKSYRQKDGLQGNFFMQNSGFQTASGKLYLGGNKGFNAFHPANINDNNRPPKVIFNNLYRFNKPVIPSQDYDGFSLANPLSALKELTLTHKESVFSIEFAGLHFADPARNQYAFRMQGVDPDWNYTDSTNRRATYTNLDPGNYSFNVKSANKDGVWTQQSTSLAITILPPWWLTWWALYAIWHRDC